MKTTILYSVIAALFICSSSIAQEQSKENQKHRYTGFGIRLPGVQVGDLQSRVTPPARIIFSLDPLEYFRLEGQYGFISTSQESTDPSAQKVKLDGSSSVFSFGAMGMYPKGNARLIFGIRYGVGNYKQESWESYPDEKIVESTGKTKTFSGVIGGEYLVAKFFSIGCEFSLSSMNDTYHPASTTSGPVESKVAMSEGNIILRFYPF